jgi:hypothetical protein
VCAVQRLRKRFAALEASHAKLAIAVKEQSKRNLELEKINWDLKEQVSPSAPMCTLCSRGCLFAEHCPQTGFVLLQVPCGY